MMKIKLTDIADLTNWDYLDENPEYANQLVTTLNKVDGFSSNGLEFYADGDHWTYDYWISPNYEIEKDAFVIGNDQVSIRSTNRDDLLNIHYYQKLSDLASNHPIEKYRWLYFVKDQVLQLDHHYKYVPYLNIKLTKPIDQYDQKQLSAIGTLMTDIYDLIAKDRKWDWKQFDEQWKQGFDQDDVKDVGIVFDLNDVANPKILMRWEDENYNNHYENDLLKNVLKVDAPLLTYLNQFKQNGRNQLIINQVNQSEQVNANKTQVEINPINDNLQQLNQPLSENFDLYVGAKGKTMLAALNNLVKNIKAIIQHNDSIKQWFLSDLKIIYQEEQALYTISGLLNIIIN